MTKITQKTALLTAFGAGLLALPFAMPSTAQADDFRIHLNLGAPAYVQPQRVVYEEYRPAPQRIVYVQQPRRVVYVSRPIYRERVVYNNGWHNGWNGGRGHHNGRHGGWDNDDRRTAWR
jgi:hypothetical protein